MLLAIPIGVQADVTFYVAHKDCSDPTDIKAHIWGTGITGTTYPGVSYNSSSTSCPVAISREIHDGISFEKFVVTTSNNVNVIFNTNGDTDKTANIEPITDSYYYVYDKSTKSYTPYSSSSALADAVMSVYVGGFNDNTWGTTTAHQLTRSGNEYYIDFTSSEFNDLLRDFNNGTYFDFRFQEKVGTGDVYSSYANNDAADSYSVLTSSYQQLRSSIGSENNRFLRVDAVSGATNYRVWYKNEYGTRYARVEVTAVPTVTFDPAGCEFEGTQNVTITSSTGSDIYYTTDGSTPTTGSAHISSGSYISLAATTTVKAGVIDNGNIVGIETYTFTKVSTSAVYFVGSILGDAWGDKTYPLIQDGYDWYIDFTAEQVENGCRDYNGNGFDFRFIETMSNSTDKVAYPTTAGTTLTAGADYVTANTGTTTDNYWRIQPTIGATKYRFWFKNDNGVRKVKYEVFTNSPNNAGYYIYGARYDGVTPSKLRYKLLPVTGSSNEYYIDLHADDKTLAGVNRYDTGNDISDAEANAQASFDSKDKTLWADMNGSTFYLAHVPTNGAAYNSYGWNNATYFYGLSNDDSSAGTKKDLYSDNKGWQISNNGGMYRFIITVDATTGVPTHWRYESHPNELVIYRVSADANWTVDAFLYCSRKEDANKSGNYHGYNQKFFGTTTFTQNGEFAFLLGDKWFKRNKNNVSNTYTKNTSLFGDGQPNLVFEYASGTYGVMFNPTQDEYQLVGASGSNVTTPITIWIAGNAVSTAELSGTYSNWSTTNSIQLTYNDEEGCWKAQIPFYSNKYMRFLNNNNKATNWGEDSYAPTADGTCENGDTQLYNHVNYNYSASTGTNINFLKPSGTYTVRFYLKAAEGEEFSSQPEYWYTLELVSESATPGIMLVPDGQADESHYTLRTESGVTFYNYNVGSNNLVVNSILENATRYKYAWGYDLTAINSATPSQGPKTGSTSAEVFRQMQYVQNASTWQMQYADDASATPSWTTDAAGDGKGYVYVKAQPVDESGNLTGAAKIYRYVFSAYSDINPSVTIAPTEGFFINKVDITATNINQSVGMKWKGGYATEAAAHAATYTDDGMKTIDLTSGTGSFSLSTPGYVAVVDELGNVAVGNFEFTYSTSENYVNYYHNGTMSQSVTQAGGKDATNIFVQVDDSYTLSIYAWNRTLDAELQAQQDKEHSVDGDGVTLYWYHQYSDDTLEKDPQTGEYVTATGERPAAGNPEGSTWQYYKNTTIGVHERDPYVKLTPDFPGTLLTDNRTFEINGEKYYYLSLPYERLRDPSEEIGFIISQVDKDLTGKPAENYANQWKTWDYVSTGNKSFIYTSSGTNVRNDQGDITTFNNKLVDISSAIGGDNAVFLHKPDGWSDEIYCHAYRDGYEPTEWKSDSERMGLVKSGADGGDLYGFNIPLTNADGTVHIIFFDGASDNRKTTDAYTSGRKTFDKNGNLTNEVHEIDSDYTLFLETPGTTTVEVTNYPNGKDYVDAVPYDKTILLDPTWGGVITSPLTDAQEETSISSWNGQTENGLRKIVDKEITQRIVGLDPSETYTVQAIVRGWGEENAKISLKVGEGQAQSFDFVSASAKSYVNKNGRVDDRYTEGPDPDDPNILPINSDYGWMKIEASGTPTPAGNLDITLTPTFGATKKYDLADVILLEDANTAGHYWTKLPTDETSAAAIKAGEIDMTNRTTYNAFSFFDRNEGNPNAIIKASNRTVIGLRDGIADVQAADGTVSKDAVDHIQSRNTISLNEDGTTWSGRYLYLYDESDATQFATAYIRSACNTYGATVPFTMIGAKYDRKFTSGNHTTIFLPYSLPTSQLKAAGFTQLANVKVISDVNSDITLNTWDLTKAEPTNYPTEAGKGYIVVAGTLPGKTYAALEDFYKPDGGIAVQPASGGQTTEQTGLVGNYEYCLRYQKDGNYMNYSYQNNKFRALSTSGAGTKPFRATFAVPLGSNASRYTILNPVFVDVDDIVPTAIDGVETVAEGDSRIYTLDGRLVSNSGKLSELPRGIYVRNGRKIVVK